jgi:predicted transcriptional regulator
MTKPVEPNDQEEDVELGEHVQATANHRRGAMVAVRVSPDLLARLNEYASARRLTVSEVMRRAAEQLTSGRATQDVAYLTGTAIVGSGVVNGTPTASGGRSQTLTAAEHETAPPGSVRSGDDVRPVRR